MRNLSPVPTGEDWQAGHAGQAGQAQDVEWGIPSAAPESIPYTSPLEARTLDDLVQCLRRLRGRNGNPSYAEIVRRITRMRAARGVPAAEQRPGRVTVYDCFRLGRRRIDIELLSDIAVALGGPAGQTAQWRRAHRAVLDGTAGAARVEVSDELPASDPWYTGRELELSRLTGRDGAGDHGVSVVTGMPGVGKTQLAARAGRLLCARYGLRPLYIGLCAFDSRHAAAAPDAVIDSLLRRLGAADSGGGGLTRSARAEMCRRLLFEHRALLMMDDAADARQVVPLLNAGHTGRLLVTSRRPLTGLPGADLVQLRSLHAQESMDLFARALGSDRVHAEPGSARRLTQLCGHLPLALRTTAAHIARTPDWSLEDHARRLAARPCDGPVRAALHESYRRLPATERRMLVLAALAPGRAVGVTAAAALVGTTGSEAQALLCRLRDEGLLQQDAPHRFRFHPTVHAYARHMLVADVSHTDQLRALRALTRTHAGALP